MSIFKKTLSYLVVGFLPVAANFLIAPLYTHYLSPDQYALIGLSALFQSFLTFFISLSLDISFSRLYFEYETDAKKVNALLSTLLGAVFIVAMLVGIVLFFTGDQLFSLVFKNRAFTFSGYGYWTMITTFSNVIFLFFSMLFRNRENIKKFAFVNLLFFFVPVSFTLGGLILFKGGARGAVEGRAIGSACCMLLFVAGYFKNNPVVFKKAYLRPALLFALPIVPYQLMFAGFSNVDRFVMERAKMFTAHDFGVYNFAVMIAGLLPVFFNVLANATTPRIFKHLINGAETESVRKFNYFNLYVSTGMICISIACVVPALRLFISSKYADCYAYVALILLSFLPYIHFLVYNVSLSYFKKTAIFPVISFAALVSGILFNLLFLQYLGIWCVCLSLFVIRIMQALVSYIYIRYYKYNRLSYVKHYDAIGSSLLIIIIYISALFLNKRYDRVPADLLNLLPVLIFAGLSVSVYRKETKMLFASLKGMVAKTKLKTD